MITLKRLFLEAPACGACLQWGDRHDSVSYTIQEHAAPIGGAGAAILAKEL